MKTLILILCVLVMFSCNKQPINSSQSSSNTCQVFFYDNYIQDSIISYINFNGSVVKLKYQNSYTYTVSVKSGDVLKIQSTNYSNNLHSNQVHVSLLNGGKLEQITPTPICTNCVWSSAVSYYDTLKISTLLTVKVQ